MTHSRVFAVCTGLLITRVYGHVSGWRSRILLQVDWDGPTQTHNRARRQEKKQNSAMKPDLTHSRACTLSWLGVEDGLVWDRSEDLSRCEWLSGWMQPFAWTCPFGAHPRVLDTHVSVVMSHARQCCLPKLPWLIACLLDGTWTVDLFSCLKYNICLTWAFRRYSYLHFLHANVVKSSSKTTERLSLSFPSL